MFVSMCSNHKEPLSCSFLIEINEIADEVYRQWKNHRGVLLGRNVVQRL